MLFPRKSSADRRDERIAGIDQALAHGQLVVLREIETLKELVSEVKDNT
jgi:hypothetical protein